MRLLRNALLGIAATTFVAACGAGAQRVEHLFQQHVTVRLTGAVTADGSYTASPLVSQSSHPCSDSVTHDYVIPPPSVQGHQAAAHLVPVRSAGALGTFKVEGSLVIDGRGYDLSQAGRVTLLPDGTGHLDFENAPALAPGTGAITGSVAWTCSEVSRTLS